MIEIDKNYRDIYPFLKRLIDMSLIYKDLGHKIILRCLRHGMLDYLLQRESITISTVCISILVLSHVACCGILLWRAVGRFLK